METEMTSRLYNITIDARDPHALAGFWRQVLGYEVAYSEPNEVGIEPPNKAAPALVFVPVPGGKAVKNRVHLDLAPNHQAAEVDRLTSLGARRIDIGQVQPRERAVP